LSERFRELAGRVGIRKVAGKIVLAVKRENKTHNHSNKAGEKPKQALLSKKSTHPMTPMELRTNASLRFPSVAIMLSSWKIAGTDDLSCSADQRGAR